jgi:hypothetical protein
MTLGMLLADAAAVFIGNKLKSPRLPWQRTMARH